MDKDGQHVHDIVPTHVGVNRLMSEMEVMFENCPHACGGEPCNRCNGTIIAELSPRMWG